MALAFLPLPSFAQSVQLSRPAANVLGLTTNSLERMRVAADGKVGIGTTNPAELLSVAGTIESTSGGIKFPDGTIQSTSAIGYGTNNTIIPNFPDLISCANFGGGGASSTRTYVLKGGDVGGTKYYLMPGESGYYLTYDGSGNYTGRGAGSDDCTSASIATLYGSGRAFNFAKGPAAQWLQNGSSAYYNAGNVGLGTSTPATKFELLNNVDSNPIIHRISNPNAGTSAVAVGSVNADTASLTYGAASSTYSGYGVIQADTAFIKGNQAGGLSLLADHASGTMRFSTGGPVERMRIDASGKIGIGNTSPSFLFEAQSDVRAQMSVSQFTNDGFSGELVLRHSRGTAASALPVQTNDRLGALLFAGSGETGTTTFPYSSSAIISRAAENFTPTAKGTYMVFETTAPGTVSRPERMRITADGLIGISNSSPTYKLDVINEAAESTLALRGYAGSPTIRGLRASGTFASPTAVTTNDTLLSVGGQGYGATGFSSVTRGAMKFQASETWTDSAQGTYVLWQTTDTGTTSTGERMRIAPNGNVGIGNTNPTAKLHVTGAINVSSCTGCSVIAEMMPVDGEIEEGLAVCISPMTGKISKCMEDSSLTSFGIVTYHAEQVLRRGCANSTTTENSLLIGGEDHMNWRGTPECEGWYPVALTGVHEFVKAECTRSDGTPMRYGDRLVTSSQRPGFVRPLAKREQGGDAVLGFAMTICSGQTGMIHVRIR